MNLGTAAVIIFVLYLIDKHGVWKVAAKIAGVLVVVAILGAGGFYLKERYEAAKPKPAAIDYDATARANGEIGDSDNPFNECWTKPDAKGLQLDQYQMRLPDGKPISHENLTCYVRVK